jgi:plasmid stabilization system protein ParE
MNFTLLFHPEIEGDLIAINSWYEEKSAGLGDEFLQIFYSIASSIINNPNLYQKVYNKFRRLLLPKFPYVVYYLLREEQVIIIGVFHHARDPRKIKKLLENRKG